MALRWFLVLVVLGCGAKTGLPIPEFDLDATVEDTSSDTPPDVPPDTPIDAFDAGMCIPFRTRADLATLDIFVLMDTSGSMNEETEAGSTKAEAVSDALSGFVRARESEGLSVALTFFPFQDIDIPEFCSNDRQCAGVEDACLQPDICLPSGSQFCRNDGDCDESGDFCEPLGRCGGAAVGGDPELCLAIGDPVCSDGSRCVDFGLCENRTSCDPGDYNRPEVRLGELPGNAMAFANALEAREFEGGTPTLPALTGVLNRARSRSRTSPGSKVIVLLATDGFPAACDPEIDFLDPDPMLGIDAPVEIAAMGAADGIQTFVIGVFAPEEEADARRNLSRLAVAGGTDEALVITTDEPVTENLLRVLNELRDDVQTCVYAIPAAGAVPDPRDLFVRLVERGGETIELERVDNADQCDAVPFGFYFQQDIEMGARPGFVELCPLACERAEPIDVTVEMEAGCRDL